MDHSRLSNRFVFRTAVLGGAAGLGAALVVGLPSAAVATEPCSQVVTTVTCTYAADSSFVVPGGVSTLRILAVGGNGAHGGTGWGAEGGAGGHGDAATIDVPVGGSTPENSAIRTASRRASGAPRLGIPNRTTAGALGASRAVFSMI